MPYFEFLRSFLRRIESIMRSFSNLTFLSKINYCAAYLSGIIIFGLVLYNSYATCSRYFFNSPPAGSMEISTFMLPVLVFLGLSFVHERRRHIAVDVLVSHLTDRQRAFFSIFANVIVVLCVAVLVWKGTELAFEKLHESSSSEIMLPLFPFYIFLPLGSLLLFLQTIRNLSDDVFSLKKRGEQPDDSK